MVRLKNEASGIGGGVMDGAFLRVLSMSVKWAIFFARVSALGACLSTTCQLETNNRPRVLVARDFSESGFDEHAA